MKDDGECFVCNANPKCGKQVLYRYCGDDDTKERFVDPFEESYGCFADREQMRNAENGVEQLCAGI